MANAERCPGGGVGEHEDERQEQDQHPGQPVGRRISPVPPDSIGEEADVQRRAQEAVADEQQPQLPVPANGAVTASRALGRAPDRDATGRCPADAGYRR